MAEAGFELTQFPQATGITGMVPGRSFLLCVDFFFKKHLKQFICKFIQVKYHLSEMLGTGVSNFGVFQNLE